MPLDNGTAPVGAQITDYAQQVAQLNRQIDALSKGGLLPSGGVDKDKYAALKQQRDSIVAKANSLIERAKRAGAAPPDFVGETKKASQALKPPKALGLVPAVKTDEGLAVGAPGDNHDTVVPDAPEKKRGFVHESKPKEFLSRKQAAEMAPGVAGQATQSKSTPDSLSSEDLNRARGLPERKEPTVGETPLVKFRLAHPEYSDMSDQELANALHDKFYKEMPREQFYAKIGFTQPKPVEQKPPPGTPRVETPPSQTMLKPPTHEGPSIPEAEAAIEKLRKDKVPQDDPRWAEAYRNRYYAYGRAESSNLGLFAGGEAIGSDIIKGARKGVQYVGSGIRDIIQRAIGEAPKKLEKEASSAAEALRGRVTKETETKTEAAATQTEDEARKAAAAAQAEQQASQGKLDAAVKTLDSDVSADMKKVQALTRQRATGAPKAKEYALPQFVKGKPIEGEVAAKSSAAPKQRLQGLSGELEQAIRTAQKGVEDHASRLYTMAAKTAGDEPIPVQGLKETIDEFMSALPEDVKMSVPPLIRNLQHSEAETMTLRELQSLRTTLRSLGNNPKLTPDLRSGPYRLLANKADELLHSPNNPPAVKQGVRIIDAGDKFYRTHMNQFRSATLQKIADDVRDGLPMDASKVLSTVAQSGEKGTLKRIVQIGGERVRIQLRNADLENLIDAAKKPGSDEIDPKKFLNGVEERQFKGTLAALYGKEGGDLLSAAKKLAAKEGAIDAKDIAPGRFRLLLRRAEELKAKAPELAKKAETAQADIDKAQKLSDTMKKDMRFYVNQLKDTSIAPDKVAAKTDSVVDSLYKDKLITAEEHARYLKEVKDVNDKYTASKKARSDTIQARKHLLYIAGGIFAAVKLWETRRAILDIVRGLGV